MIGLDTNVLVRYLAQDDKDQSKSATSLIEKNVETSYFYINNIVLVELVWVLQGAYKLNKENTVNIIEKFLHTTQFKVQEQNNVWQALTAYKDGTADFADYLSGQNNLTHRCQYTATFDVKASRSKNFMLLE